MHAQSCPTLCNPMDYSPAGSSVNGIFQVKILECVAISSFKWSSQLRDQTLVSCIEGRFLPTRPTANESMIPLCSANVRLNHVYLPFQVQYSHWSLACSGSQPSWVRGCHCYSRLLHMSIFLEFPVFIADLVTNSSWTSTNAQTTLCHCPV